MEAVDTDEQAIMGVIETIEENEYEDYFYSSLDDENEDALMKPVEDFLMKPIWPLRFGRIGIRPLVKDISVECTSENTATVTFRKILNGNFVVLAAHTPEEHPVEIYRVIKPMVHEFQRIAHFEKVGDEDMPLRDRWKLVDFSMALGKSMDLNETNIENSSLDITLLKIEYDDNVIEITDPLSHFQTKDNVFTFERGTEVTLTVHVKNNADKKALLPNHEYATELVRLHFARHRFRRFHGIRRFEFVEQLIDGTNVYTGTWTVGDWVRLHHAAIDVIDAGTIFDDDVDEYPYNSVTWCTPYKVVPPTL
jgi:hypothetical protein